MDVLRRNNVQVLGRPDGRAVIFAHGFGCSLNMWRYVVPAFTEDHRIVLFDHVGAGASDLGAYDPIRHADLAGYAQDVVDIIEALELSDVVFVGHSVSAMIGVLASVARPDLFGELVLIGPSPRYVDDVGYTGGFSRTDIDELLDLIDRNHLAFSAAMAPVIMGNPDQPDLALELEASFCRTDPTISKQFARTTFLSDNRADLGRVRARTLVLQCSEDVIAPDEVGRYVADAIPGSQLRCMVASGHCPNLSAPGETAAAIRDFLGAVPRTVYDLTRLPEAVSA